jgi:hypothetical protein
MQEVASMLRAAGIEPLMAEATARRQTTSKSLLQDVLDGHLSAIR